jgi:hypothetical protein
MYHKTHFVKITMATQYLSRLGVKIVSIGIAMKDTDEIFAIASSDDDVFQASDFKSLLEIRQDISENSCKKNGS